MASNKSVQKLLQNILKDNKIEILPIDQAFYKVTKLESAEPIIANTAIEKNGHFIVFAQINRNSLLIFDPLASDLTKYIIEPLAKSFDSVYFNLQQLQDNESEFCSIFCASFAVHLVKKREISEYFDLFSRNDLTLNDGYATDYLFKEIYRL